MDCLSSAWQQETWALKGRLVSASAPGPLRTLVCRCCCLTDERLCFSSLPPHPSAPPSASLGGSAQPGREVGSCWRWPPCRAPKQSHAFLPPPLTVACGLLPGPSRCPLFISGKVGRESSLGPGLGASPTAGEGDQEQHGAAGPRLQPGGGSLPHFAPGELPDGQSQGLRGAWAGTEGRQGLLLGGSCVGGAEGLGTWMGEPSGALMVGADQQNWTDRLWPGVSPGLREQPEQD